jgi:hypothetical protein
MNAQEESTTTKRRAQLCAAAEVYFAALALKDFTAIPYADAVVLRALLAPGGVHNPLIGKEACARFGGRRWCLPWERSKSSSIT